MIAPLFALFALVQQAPQGPAAPPATPSPIAKVVVTPAQPRVTSQDTLRLTARALDASGQPVAGARIRFLPAGGYFEGRVDSTGLVEAGSTGTLPVSVVAFVPGTRPVVERVEVAMVAGP